MHPKYAPQMCIMICATLCTTMQNSGALANKLYKFDYSNSIVPGGFEVMS